MRLEEKRNEKEEEKRWKNNEFKNKKNTMFVVCPTLLL
jgi:hypothetical protein